MKALKQSFVLCFAMLAMLSVRHAHAAACVPTGISAASIDFYADDEIDVYINGTLIGGCTSKCYKTLTTIDVLAAGATINLPPADNVIATYVRDTGGNISGENYDLTLTFTGCPVQHVISDAFCTRLFYAGNTLGTSGAPPVFLPPGWETPAFVDTGWNGSSSSIPNVCNLLPVPCFYGFWVNLGAPWMSVNPDDFRYAYKGDGYLYRQHFRTGDSSYCPIPPGPTPTPFTTITPGTVTPGPAGSNTVSPTKTATPDCSSTVPTSATITFLGDNYVQCWVNGTQITFPVAIEVSGVTVAPSGPWTVPVGALLPFPQINIVAFQIEDTAINASGNFAGVTYDLAISYASGCTVQHVISDGNCVSTRQSGLRAARSPQAGWLLNTFSEDASWFTPFANSPCFCDSGCVYVSGDPCPGANWGSLPGVPKWISQQSGFLDVSDKGSQDYRQHFQLGVNGCPPPTPTLTFTRSRTRTPSPSITPTPTATPSTTISRTATSTSTSSPTPSATPSFTPTPTRSATQTWTPSPTNTVTFTPTASHTPTFSKTATPTWTPTATTTITFTASATHTPTATQTVTRTWTQTHTPTSSVTATPTWTPTATTTITFTASSSPTPTPSVTATRSWTQTVTPTQSDTVTPTWTPTATTTITFTASTSPTPTPTQTVTRTWTQTQTPSHSRTATATVTLTATPSSSLTATETETPTFTDSPIASDTVSPTNTPSDTVSPTETPSVTDTASPTGSASPSATLTWSPTPSITLTVTSTFTDSPLASDTVSPTLSVTPPDTATPSQSPSVSPTVTPSMTDSPIASDTPSPSVSPSPTGSSSASPSFTATPTVPTSTVTPTGPPAPAKFKIVSVYPNPAGSTGAWFVVSLPRPAEVRFMLYDLRGEVIWSKKNSYALSGNYEMHWPLQNNSGSAVSYGAYYLSAIATYAIGNETDGRWLTVVR